MFDLLIKNGIKKKMMAGFKFGDEDLKFEEKDFKFIHELIVGLSPTDPTNNVKAHMHIYMHTYTYIHEYSASDS